MSTRDRAGGGRHDRRELRAGASPLVEVRGHIGVGGPRFLGLLSSAARVAPPAPDRRATRTKDRGRRIGIRIPLDTKNAHAAAFRQSGTPRFNP